ncbi:hypothetical protein BDV38DRAFT_152804 [Aspergillus pseudotamarii]|uniref:Uncharacterized protein n=1 Tax=Aspergillus pseudotamarii TaxID=132259 RepID=A0A5N6T7F8_ASPPS|nr:uncharacterized protein BDV38DRAFT_152804 [Aspergillus pseudotamarii]KAE8142273.1 hypothetical protein BDV38DRAFT_152804 [Aspergillus pseudotamarii]
MVTRRPDTQANSSPTLHKSDVSQVSSQVIRSLVIGIYSQMASITVFGKAFLLHIVVSAGTCIQFWIASLVQEAFRHLRIQNTCLTTCDGRDCFLISIEHSLQYRICFWCTWRHYCYSSSWQRSRIIDG